MNEVRELLPHELRKLRRLNTALEHCERDIFNHTEMCGYRYQIVLSNDENHWSEEAGTFYYSFGGMGDPYERECEILCNLLKCEYGSALLAHYLFYSSLTLNNLLDVDTICIHAVISVLRVDEPLHRVYDYKSGLWGYADISGKIAIPYQYRYANQFHKEAALVLYDKKWMHIDRQGCKR